VVRKTIKRNVGEHGLLKGIRESFGEHSEIKVSDAIAALPEYSQHGISSIFAKLVQKGEIVPVGRGIYKRREGESDELVKARRNLDALASHLKPTREELDDFIMQIHTLLSTRGITSREIVEAIEEKLPHRLAKKYPGESTAQIRRKLRGAVSKKLNYLKASGTINAIEAKYVIHAYPGVEVDLNEFEEKPGPAKKKPAKKKPEKKYIIPGYGELTPTKVADILSGEDN